MKTFPLYQRQQGFSIIEVIIVVAVLAILTAVAAPSFQRFTSNSKVKTGAQDLYSAMLYARSEAIKRNANVTITPMNAADWSEGWTITTPAEANPLKIHDSVDGVLEDPSSNLAGVVYNKSGRIEAAGNVQIFFCDDKADPAKRKATKRKVSITLTGQPKIETDGACAP